MLEFIMVIDLVRKIREGKSVPKGSVNKGASWNGSR